MKLAPLVAERPSVAAPCPWHPNDDGPHECMPDERRCVYCGTALEAYPCHGCGKFLTAVAMHLGGRCEDCQ